MLFDHLTKSFQTAGHCALAKADGHRLSSVRVGEFDSTKDPDCAESGFCAPSAINHAVSHVVVHPDYVNGQYHHDIALLILRTPINYTVAAQPICLQRDRSNLVVGKRATVIGWGKVSLSSIRSPEMQYMDMPLASWDQCLRVYGSSGALDSQKSIGEHESGNARNSQKFEAFLRKVSNGLNELSSCAFESCQLSCQQTKFFNNFCAQNGI